jgi:threonine dehydratase
MLSLSDVEAARERLGGVARHTPMDHSHTFSDWVGAEIHLKLENMQRTGSFKIRGASNRIQQLSADEQARGVVTASAGNHAQGVALAATRAGVDSKIVMPEFAPISKVRATERYDAEVVLSGEDYAAAAETAHQLEERENRTYIHAFDDEAVMAGQGTIGLEIMDDCPAVDTVVVPIGGGGLIAGIATAVKGINPDVRIVGVQAEGASSAAESLQKGQRVTLDSVDTIADGIATRSVGAKTFEVITERVDEVVTVNDREIAMALVSLLERSKTLVEGAGAVSVAALLENRFAFDETEVIVPACCGGNIDLNVLQTVITRGLVERGRFLRIQTILKDRPGALEHLTEVIAANRANIHAIQHDRASKDVALNAADVELDLETRGHDHAAELVTSLEEHGYEVKILG